MKLLFFSDVHGSPESLELLERHIDSRSPDLLVLLGDALYHGPRNPLRPDYAPPQVVEQLNRRKEQIVAVRGNCDSEVDQMLLEFPLMSDYSTLLVDGHRFFLTHGHLWNPGQLPPIPAGAVFTYGPSWNGSKTVGSLSIPAPFHCPKEEILPPSASMRMGCSPSADCRTPGRCCGSHLSPDTARHRR